MKPLLRNPLFSLSLVLAVALGFQVYGIVGAAYTPPTQSPTLGMPAEPLNTGTDLQTKQGALSMKGGLIVSENGTLQNGLVNVGTQFLAKNWDTTGNVYFAADNGKSAAIRLDSTSGKLMFRNSGEGWKEFGTGTGAELWKKETNTQNIAYEGGNVFIKSSITPGQAGVTRYYYTYTKQGGVTNVAPTKDMWEAPCSRNPLLIECGNSFDVYEDLYPSGTVFPQNMYDECAVGAGSYECAIFNTEIPNGTSLYQLYVRGDRKSQTTGGTPSQARGGNVSVDGSASFVGGKAEITSNGISTNGTLTARGNAYLFGTANIKDIYLSSKAQGGNGISVTSFQTFLIVGGCQKSAGICAAGTGFGEMGGGDCKPGFTKRDLGVILLCTFP